MRLGISNIAWDIVEDELIAALLCHHQIDAIDVAPGKYFPNPAKATEDEINQVRYWWAERGIEITGMQALLFGTTGLNVFGPSEVQQLLLQHLGAICRIGGNMKASRLVFGSPKNRDRSGLTETETIDLATSFFRRLGDIAGSWGVTICLEPNPPCYGANFMTTSAETAKVVESIGHPAIRMQLDTGAMAINGEDPTEVLSAYAGLIGHIHASEPQLVPLGDGETDHAKVSSALLRYLPDKLVTIEMLATQSEPHIASVGRALNVAIRHYRQNGIGESR